MNPIASDVLVFGLVLLFVGGILAMKGVISEDANSAPANHVPVRVGMRRSLPRHGVCPVGIILAIVGVVSVIASYFVRL